ncbi:MAG: serine hydrolase domain-containing protein [Terriglobales bacterium]
MKNKLVVLVLAVVSVCAVAQDVSSKVDDYVAAEMKAEQSPGVALAIVKNGTIVKLKGYGFANLEHMVPVHPDTIFQSGSVGKQFTAAGVLMLVEQGAVGLDDPIGKYFENAPAAWNNIKVRSLLSHTSGIPDYESAHSLDLRRDYTEDELLKFAETLPPDFAPGTKWKYSNTGYVLLGILIHKVTGEFYGDFLREHIWQPLGMETTRIISESDIVPNRADGYRNVKGEWKHQEWVAPTLNTTADGSLYLTAIDMVKWDAELRARKLLKPKSYEAWWTPIKLNDGSLTHYGFGWFLERAGNEKLIEHTGQWQGFKSHIARYVDEDLTVIVLANLEDGDTKKIAHAVAEMYGAPAVK